MENNICVFAVPPTAPVQSPTLKPLADPVFSSPPTAEEQLALDAAGCHKFTCGCTSFDVFVHHRQDGQVVNMFDEAAAKEKSSAPLSLIMSPSLMTMMQHECHPIGQCMVPVDLAEPCFCPPSHAGRFCDRCAEGFENYPHCVPKGSPEAVAAAQHTPPPGLVTKSFTSTGCHQYTCGCANFDVFDRFVPIDQISVFVSLDVHSSIVSESNSYSR
jgi:hypothetical protein